MNISVRRQDNGSNSPIAVVGGDGKHTTPLLTTDTTLLTETQTEATPQ